ncbi:MAG: Periplasmic sensor signal transduction histidine kinase [Nitrospira sp.]|jgi:signal transduction histidine kinase|nr:MAG: Periplasmic sensor signal transduction histidine kinase [Nitrospira sp.]
MTTTSRPLSKATGWGLKRKLIVSMLLVGVVPLLLGLGMAFLQGSKEIQVVSGESFQALATEAARKLDLLVAEEVARTSRIAVHPDIVRELEHRRDALQSPDKNPAHIALARQRTGWETRDPAAVKALTENSSALLLQGFYVGAHSEPDQLLPQVVRAATKKLFITDVQGNLFAALTTKPDFAHADSPWWKGTYNNGVGQLFIEDLHFDDQANAYVFSISLPIMDSLRYEVVGVLHRVIDAKEFFSPSIHPIRFGKTGHVMLIDSRGIVLSCPILPTGVRLSDPALIPHVTLRQSGWVTADSDGHGGSGTAIIGFAPLPETSRATNGSLELGAWHTFVWQSSDELFAPIRHLMLWMVILALVALGLLATLGYLAASRIVTPVRRLQEAARLIGRGELREPIQIHTGDELEDLAVEFNRMHAQLETAFAGLNTQVEEKTQEVHYLQKSTDQVLDAVPTPIIMVDQQNRVQYMNRASREALDTNGSDWSARPLFDLLPIDHGHREALQRDLRLVDQGGPRESPLSDPTFAPKEARDPLAPALGHALSTNRRELTIGNHVYHYEWFSLESRSGAGKRFGLVLRDTTDESRLQDQLIQAEKSGSLDVLTAGIGHELNNPLFGILGLGEAIQEEGDLARAKSYAQDIVDHGRRMAAIIRDFTGMAARESKNQRMPVDVTAQLEQALMIIQTSHDCLGINVQKHYVTLPPVTALPDQLRLAFINILTNAIQAMGGRGDLWLSTEEQGGVITIKIRDNGPGIPKQHLGKVFDPFFTTKGQGEGSGLGLTVAQRLIKKFGGEIRLESPEGQGTTCIITLPTEKSGVRKEESCMSS